jgi:hypothetical protein
MKKVKLVRAVLQYARKFQPLDSNPSDVGFLCRVILLEL